MAPKAASGRNLGEYRSVLYSGTTSTGTAALEFCRDMSRNARNNKNGKKENIMANLANMANMAILPQSPTRQSTKQ